MVEPPSDPHPDWFLVQAALRGDPEAIEQLANRLRCVPRILRGSNARMGRPLDEHDLADLSQDVTVIILEKLDQYAGRAPFEAWVYRICRLELMNGIRRKGRGRASGEIDFEQIPDAPDHQAEATDAEVVHGLLARLGGVEAEVLRLKHFDGLTFEEIGSRLGISPNTAKTRYYRGMVRIQSWLGGEGGEARGTWE